MSLIKTCILYVLQFGHTLISTGRMKSVAFPFPAVLFTERMLAATAVNSSEVHKKTNLKCFSFVKKNNFI